MPHISVIISPSQDILDTVVHVFLVQAVCNISLRKIILIPHPKKNLGKICKTDATKATKRIWSTICNENVSPSLQCLLSLFAVCLSAAGKLKWAYVDTHQLGRCSPNLLFPARSTETFCGVQIFDSICL